MLKNEKLLKGYDFTFSQYCNALNEHIKIELDKDFKNLFIRNFLKRYFYVNTIADDYDLFFDYMETEFETVLPLYEKQYLLIKSLKDEDLFENAESTTDSNGKANTKNKTTSKTTNKSDANSKSFGSRFPEEIVNHDSINYSDSGNHTESEGNGQTDTDGTTDSDSTNENHVVFKNKVGSRLDRTERFIQLQTNIFNNLLNEFKDLFIMIY